MKKIITSLILLCVVIFLGKNLNPFDSRMFSFHDETQAARVQQFTLNLKTLHIPPRIAPDFSFHMGYPVFNFYAPTAYWITSGLNLLGIPVAQSLKISFLLALILGFCGTYMLFRQYLDYENAVLGGALYVSSLYMAVDIFVRGNLSEVWFMALMPLALCAVGHSFLRGRLHFFIAVCILSLTFTSHNLLSLLFIPVLGIYIFVVNKSRQRVLPIFATGIALAIGMYFFLPLFLESSLTYAAEVAKSTHYADHFLCPTQLWQSPWGFGGSAPGCDADGLSFKVGKPQLVLALLGFLYLLVSHLFTHKPRNRRAAYFFSALALISLFLTTYQSRFLWDSMAPIAAIIQFPWRFISFSLLGLAYLSGFCFQQLRSFNYKPLFIGCIAIISIFSASKYYYKEPLSAAKYHEAYLSPRYIAEQVAFKISEYLPRSADYSTWKDAKLSRYDSPAIPTKPQSVTSISNTGYIKSVKMAADDTIRLEIHSFPYWRITVNSAPVIPSHFDRLGRPILTVKKDDIVTAVFNQSPVENIGNSIALLSLCILTAVVVYKPLWKKLSSLST